MKTIICPTCKKEKLTKDCNNYNCKECAATASSLWRAKRKATGLCRDCDMPVKNPNGFFCEHHINEQNVRSRKINAEIKELVFQHYGKSCACCGESMEAFLTIDHINGGGSAHRKETGAGSMFYKWLKRNNFPAGYQTLCYNCNCAKGRLGFCPHEKILIKTNKCGY